MPISVKSLVECTGGVRLSVLSICSVSGTNLAPPPPPSDTAWPKRLIGTRDECIVLDRLPDRCYFFYIFIVVVRSEVVAVSSGARGAVMTSGLLFTQASTCCLWGLEGSGEAARAPPAHLGK